MDCQTRSWEYESASLNIGYGLLKCRISLMINYKVYKILKKMIFFNLSLRQITFMNKKNETLPFLQHSSGLNTILMHYCFRFCILYFNQT